MRQTILHADRPVSIARLATAASLDQRNAWIPPELRIMDAFGPELTM